MDGILYVMTFLISWTIALFLVLPVGIERPRLPGRFDDAGAPARPRLREKLLLSAIVAGIVTAAFVLVVRQHWVSFR